MAAIDREAAADRAGTLGGLAWLLCLQFFLAEQIATLFWRGSYSFARNFISDLGAGCPLQGATGCAGWPALMNGSFVLQGILIGAGALLLWRRASGLAERLGLLFAAISAPGVFLVGLFPEDAAPSIHHDAAAVHFVALSLSAFCFAAALRTRGERALPFAVLSLIAALTGTTGTALLGLHMDLGFGAGAVERLVAYPFPIWLAALGLGYRGGQLDATEAIPITEPTNG
ncbi:MAG: DUF998 domain-containing protein [Paracoccaceae bacterium]|nr:DUF998 domain-containing protein [Paracoccaceae bacterium]